MILALASKKFINKDIPANLSTILACLKECALQNVDLLCFGEAFLHGFDGLDWKYEKDVSAALSVDSEVFLTISNAARECGVAAAFGYIEHDKGFLYSSYAVISKEGDLLCNFRRVSVGWKEPCIWNDPRYKEGEGFSAFSFMDRQIAVGLCGDFWYGENIEKIQNIDCDFVLWPLFIDFSAASWESEEKSNYAKQAGIIHEKVLLINSMTDEPTPAVGGCIYFRDGNIISELPPNTDDLLILQL